MTTSSSALNSKLKQFLESHSYSRSLLLLTAKEAAAYRRQGLSTFWRQVKLGQVPKPIYITPRSPRWRLSDLCPQRPVVTPNN